MQQGSHTTARLEVCCLRQCVNASHKKRITEDALRWETEGESGSIGRRDQTFLYRLIWRERIFFEVGKS